MTQSLRHCHTVNIEDTAELNLIVSEAVSMLQSQAPGTFIVRDLVCRRSARAGSEGVRVRRPEKALPHPVHQQGCQAEGLQTGARVRESVGLHLPVNIFANHPLEYYTKSISVSLVCTKMSCPFLNSMENFESIDMRHDFEELSD